MRLYQPALLPVAAFCAAEPRTTRVGRWLRRLRLDELPQLFNVIRGEMSIVGPKPQRPEFVSVLLAPYIVFSTPKRCGWAAEKLRGR